MIEIAPVEILGVEIVIRFVKACIEIDSGRSPKEETPQ